MGIEDRCHSDREAKCVARTPLLLARVIRAILTTDKTERETRCFPRSRQNRISDETARDPFRVSFGFLGSSILEYHIDIVPSAEVEL